MAAANSSDTSSGPVADSGAVSTRSKFYGAKTLFWYLRFFFTMGFSAGATGTLWFQFINKLFPLEVALYRGGVNRPYDERAVIWAISALVILAPTFYVFAAILRKAIGRNEVELDRGVRQWTSYVFLLIVVAIMVGDMITALRYVLNGDYTTRFFLKVLTILVITGWLFSYVWLELRSKNAFATSTLPRTMGITSAIVMVISVAAAFTLIDSPALARAKSFDRQREYDIRALQNGVRNFYRRDARMPESLRELHEEGYVHKRAMEDPKTGDVYAYRIVNEEEFEICATFATDNREDDEGSPRAYRPTGPYGGSYRHGAEHTCFTQKAAEQRPGPPNLWPPAPPK